LDFDAIDCNDTLPNDTIPNDDELSDYGESFKPPSKTYRQSSRGGREKPKVKASKRSDPEDDELSNQSLEGNGGSSMGGF
jgi:hypothetical protein